MPLLIMHGGRPAVAIANKTPNAAKSVIPPSGKDDAMNEILRKLTAIEMELGITPPKEPPSEEEILKRQAFVEKMRLAKEQRQKEIEDRKKDFLKRMKKGKKRAERMRENG